MKGKVKALTLMALAIALTSFVSPSAEAQSMRRTTRQEGFYRIPGTNVRMFPAPRYQYQFGGTRIYMNRNPNWGNGCWPYRSYNNWQYGYGNGYSWPYGYPSNYSWPYGYRN